MRQSPPGSPSYCEGMSSATAPDPAQEPPGTDLAALSDLCTPWCLHVVATLRIAEHVAAGVTGIDDLAAAAGSDAHALHSVMGHLVANNTQIPQSYQLALGHIHGAPVYYPSSSGSGNRCKR